METVVQDDAMLLHGSNERVGSALAHLHALGVDTIRLTASWSDIAPLPDSATKPSFDASNPAAYPPGGWARLDRAVAMAGRYDFELMIDIAFWAPRWATERASTPASRQRHGVDAGDFADFAEAVARRYSGTYMRGRPASIPFFDRRRPLPAVATFTIWNEPNDPGFMLPQWRKKGKRLWSSSPHRYRRMVAESYPRIKRAAPHARVLIGATTSRAAARPRTVRSRMAPLRFMREMACVGRDLRPMRRRECRDFEPIPGDGWSHHPYSIGLTPWQRDPLTDNVRMADLGRMTSLLGRLNDRGRMKRRMDVWVTEYGYETSPPDPIQRFTPNHQARFLPEAELLAYFNPNVRSFAQFLLRDLPERQASTPRLRWRDYQTGLQFADGTPKPAETAFRYPLVVRRAGPRAVWLWGLVRPGAGRRSVRVSTPLAGRIWSPVPGLPSIIDTDERGHFAVEANADPDALYRIEVLEDGVWKPGVAIRAAR